MIVSSLLALKKKALGIDLISSINVLGEWTVRNLKNQQYHLYLLKVLDL